MFFVIRCFCHLRALQIFGSYSAVLNKNISLPSRFFHIKSILYIQNTDLVRVIDESGTNLGLMSKREADILAEQKKVLLNEVVKATDKNPNRVFKLIIQNSLKETQSAQQKGGGPTQNLKDQKSFVPTKEITMKSQIDDNDLTVKSKKLQQFLDKGYHVTIKISKPKRATRLPRETYELLVSRLHEEFKMVGGAAKSSAGFFRCTLVKNGRGKK